jgi:hypothetical protein
VVAVNAVAAPPDMVGATVTLPGGQTRLALPTVLRHPHPTGVQVDCAACVGAGVLQPRQGMPDRFVGDPTPLCMPCWLAEQHRRQRAADEALLARYWESVAGVVSVAEVAAVVCPACEQPEPGPTCWLCSYTWLAQARVEFAAELELDAVEVAASLQAIEAVTDAEARVAELAGWVERLRACLDAYGRSHQGGRGRPVELLADLMARDAADRTTLRGRPGALHRVAAGTAVDADWRSGRRALPGRARLAELVGCSERAVTSAWRRAMALGWMERTREGRRLTLAERRETGRSNDRSEFDIVQLHTSEVDTELRAEWVPVALGVLGDLVEHAEVLLGEAEEELESARVRYGAWTDWSERVRSAQRRRAVDQVLAQVCAWPAATLHAANIFPPRTASRGEYFSSGPLLGLRYSPPIMIRFESGRGTANGGRGQDGASRSPAEGALCDLDCAGCGGRQDCGSQYVARPRTLDGSRRRSRRVERPEWAWWAYPLARELAGWWPWLAGSPVPWVTAALGAALGPDWTAQAVVDLVRARCGPPAPAEAICAPAAYLRELLRQALAGPRMPSHPARAHDEQRRAQVAEAAVTGRAHAAAVAAEATERAAAGTVAAASSAAGSLAALRASLPAGLRRPDRVALLGGPGPLAGAPGEAWPAVAQPGAGLPPGLAG